jgi:DNA mismatch endonuclease, patch repair protein
MDNVTPKKRREIMQSVKALNTGPELLLRRELHRLGYRYRLHVKTLPGSPDIAFSARRKLIFVHGCFWHSHRGCSRARLPKTNIDFWKAKRASNRKRDARVLRDLVAMGWKVLIVWQCELRDLATSLHKVRHFLECPNAR